jgi:hypothetical protein
MSDVKSRQKRSLAVFVELHQEIDVIVGWKHFLLCLRNRLREDISSFGLRAVNVFILDNLSGHVETTTVLETLILHHHPRYQVSSHHVLVYFFFNLLVNHSLRWSFVLFHALLLELMVEALVKNVKVEQFEGTLT